jgi:hypothetical protein
MVKTVLLGVGGLLTAAFAGAGIWAGESLKSSEKFPAR